MGPRAKAETPHTIVNVTLEEGDWIDVMDSEGTWNIAQVLSFPNSKTVEVKYDGWGAEYNEVVPLNSDRVAPYHTYTWSVKCWAKYKNWPWWPSIVTIRSPGTSAGQEYLQREDRLFVDFMDRKDFARRCRCWIELSKVKPFEDHYDERRKRTSGSDFEASLAMALKSTASNKFPTFSQGTLPTEFKSAIASSVKAMKKKMGMTQWAGALSTNLARHRAVYMYKPPGSVDDVDEDDDEEDDYVVQFAELSDEDGPKKSHAKAKAKAPVRAKARKLGASGAKSPTSKRREEERDVLVRAEDSTHIIEGPHAPRLTRDLDEQPLYLPPIEEQPDDTSTGPLHRRSSRSSGSSSQDIQQSRKRAREDSADASSVDVMGVAKQVVDRRKAGV